MLSWKTKQSDTIPWEGQGMMSGYKSPTFSPHPSLTTFVWPQKFLCQLGGAVGVKSRIARLSPLGMTAFRHILRSVFVENGGMFGHNASAGMTEKSWHGHRRNEPDRCKRDEGLVFGKKQITHDSRPWAVGTGPTAGIRNSHPGPDARSSVRGNQTLKAKPRCWSLVTHLCMAHGTPAAWEGGFGWLWHGGGLSGYSLSALRWSRLSISLISVRHLALCCPTLIGVWLKHNRPEDPCVWTDTARC